MKKSEQMPPIVSITRYDETDDEFRGRLKRTKEKKMINPLDALKTIAPFSGEEGRRINLIIRGALEEIEKLRSELKECYINYSSLDSKFNELCGCVENLRPENTELASEKEQLQIQYDDCYRVMSRIQNILASTVNVLKGPPDELALHSTHDAAEVAKKLIDERDQLRGDLETVENKFCDIFRKNISLRRELAEPLDSKNDEPEECQTCGGTGIIMSIDNYGNGPVESKEDCPDCEGE